MPEEYPAQPPFVWYRRHTSATTAEPKSPQFDDAMIARIAKKLDVPKETTTDGGDGIDQNTSQAVTASPPVGDEQLERVNIPLLDQDRDTAWSRSCK